VLDAARGDDGNAARKAQADAPREHYVATHRTWDPDGAEFDAAAKAGRL
jgi:hypothetical protein